MAPLEVLEPLAGERRGEGQTPRGRVMRRDDPPLGEWIEPRQATVPRNCRVQHRVDNREVFVRHRAARVRLDSGEEMGVAGIVGMHRQLGRRAKGYSAESLPTPSPAFTRRPSYLITQRVHQRANSSVHQRFGAGRQPA